MRAFEANCCWQKGALLSGLVLVAFLQGCHRGFVEVSVNVQMTCPPKSGGGGEGGGQEDEPTACLKQTIVSPWNTDANTYFTNGTQVPTGQSPPYRCVAGTGNTRCKSPSGTCTLGGPPCKTWWISPVSPGSRDGNCRCDCANAYP